MGSHNTEGISIDKADPALNTVITVMSLVASIFAPVLVDFCSLPSVPLLEQRERISRPSKLTEA